MEIRSPLINSRKEEYRDMLPRWTANRHDQFGLFYFYFPVCIDLCFSCCLVRRWQTGPKKSNYPVDSANSNWLSWNSRTREHSRETQDGNFRPRWIPPWKDSIEQVVQFFTHSNACLPPTGSFMGFWTCSVWGFKSTKDLHLCPTMARRVH